MNAIDCVLVPVHELDYFILAKMRVFGIYAPDEDKIMYGRGLATPHYCVSHVKSRFDEHSFAALDSEETINDSTKKSIKIQYLKICSLAFMFGIGKDCVRDRYNRLIPINLAAQNQRNIFQNNGAYSPSLVSEVARDVYDRLHQLQEYKIITSDQKWRLIDRYQEQLDRDDLILEEIDFEQQQFWSD
jgi:hypothetical protein